MPVMTCKLWVQDAWYETTIRADKILAVRAAFARGRDDDTQNWVLEAVAAEPLGQDGSHVVPLLRFVAEGLALDAHLLHFIAAHIDDPDGGLITCSHQRIAEESADVVFDFRSFDGNPPQYPPRPAPEKTSEA